MEYAREYCGYMDNYEFSSRTIILTAMTGVAATILLGETAHSAVYLNQQKPLEAEQIELWESTRLLIIDEISFASKEDFAKLHRKIRQLKQCLHKPYGGLNIIFSGDMRQLEPVGEFKKPVYTEECPEFKDWVNSFIELNRMHRFKDDPEWGLLLFRFRDGEVTEAGIDRINERVVKPHTKLPEDIRYATYFNRDRDSINAALFQQQCDLLYRETGNTGDSIMIFSDDHEIQNSHKTYVPFRNCLTFWENTTEDDVTLPRGAGRMDPVLRLYQGCCVMLPCNTDVKKGQANGMQATFQKVVLKLGEATWQILLDGTIPVMAVRTSQVSRCPPT
jgi:PIF1-like helicase